MDVIYYYSFLFYTKILKEDEPHATTVWALGFAEGYFLKIISDIIIIRFSCSNIIEYTFFPIIGITLLSNYFHFSKSKRSRKIVKEKPVFFESHRVSIILTVIFFTALISSMFWGGFYTKYLLDTHCK